MRVGGKSRKSRSVKLPRIKLIPLKLCLWPSVTIFSFSDKSREHRELSYLSSQTMAILSHCFSLLNRETAGLIRRLRRAASLHLGLIVADAVGRTCVVGQ